MNLPKSDDIEVFSDSKAQTFTTVLTETTWARVPVALQKEMKSKYQAFTAGANKATVALARANNLYQQPDKTFAVYVIGMSNMGEARPSLGFLVEGLNPKSVIYNQVRDEMLKLNPDPEVEP